ncbi:MAG TPA: UDP-N-acetylmuramoyl-L-alanine--D-glutamate ligase [Terriglobia bacterium]|nr:UDP-N-acetylmuramoyl-L-alanine--D-glutamate ligase [Terriglobia bacterium]
MEVQNKHVLVVGLARSGLAVAYALLRRGAMVTVMDRKPPAEFREVLPELVKNKVGVELGSQREETFLRHDFIVISPGVPWDLPQLQAARERKIPVYPEVEAASWFLEGTLVGVTGSNGKTTTTSLLGDMLKGSGYPTFVGGNIGNALSLAVDHAQPGTIFVTELSSFQLEGIHDFRPHVAVMLNLSPNHLDRHPNLEAYAQAKRQIFRNQQGQDYAVLNADDPWVAGLQPTVPSQPVLFSRRRELANGVFVSKGKVYYRVRHLERVLFETRDVNLKGDFNLEDVLAATTAACLLGADFAAIRKAVREFQAVEHRLEFVQEIQGVDFYNNSKATSVDATLKSLEAFERGVHLILGGKDKGAPYTPLVALIKERVREVLLIGAAAPVITQQLAGQAELVQAGDLATAVNQAFARSRPGDTVLLAPACSSFDQFKDYEERGRVFKELVKQLASDVSAGRVARPKLAAPSAPEPPPIEPPADKTSPETAAVPAGGQAESPVGGVEIPALPASPWVDDRSAAEKRSAARRRARELASEPARKVVEPPSNIAPPEQPASPPVAELPPSPVPFAVEHAKAVADEPFSMETAPPSTDPGAKPVTVETREPADKTDEPAIHPPVSASKGRPKAGSTPPPGEKGTAPAVPHHVELSYVYEVDAVDLPGMESQVAPEDEPTISISAGSAEVLNDEVMPFEARPPVKESGFRRPKSGMKGRSGVRNPESGGQGPGPKDQRPFKHPKLFEGSED